MSEALRDLAEPYRQAGINMHEHHVPAPLPHRPNVERIESNGYVGVVMKELYSGASIHCENPVEVRQ